MYDLDDSIINLRQKIGYLNIAQLCAKSTLYLSFYGIIKYTYVVCVCAIALKKGRESISPYSWYTSTRPEIMTGLFSILRLLRSLTIFFFSVFILRNLDISNSDISNTANSKRLSESKINFDPKLPEVQINLHFGKFVLVKNSPINFEIRL